MDLLLIFLVNCQSASGGCLAVSWGDNGTWAMCLSSRNRLAQICSHRISEGYKRVSRSMKGLLRSRHGLTYYHHFPPLLVKANHKGSQIQQGRKWTLPPDGRNCNILQKDVEIKNCGHFCNLPQRTR